MPAFLHFRQCSDCETSHSGAKVLLKMGQPSCRCASLDRSRLPRPALSRGRDERSSLWEGWGEGLPPQTPNMDVCSIPIAQISDFNFQTPLETSIRDLAARSARGLRHLSPSWKVEGAGKAGCALHPRSRVQNAHRIRTRAYRFSGGNPAFPARWFTAYFALSPVTGLFCHRRRRNHFHQLDTSVGVSGPHDFAVRSCAVRQWHYQRPPHPIPRS
jgi:hypothetical protein